MTDKPLEQILNEYAALLRMVERLKEIDATQNIANNLLAGLTKSKKENWSGAKRDLDTVIDADPDNFLAHFLRGFVNERLDNKSDALEDYNAVVESNPNWKEVYFRRGFVNSHFGNLLAALDDFDKAVKLCPNAPAYINRGLTKKVLKDLSGALEDFDKAVELAPDNADARLKRGSHRYYLSDFKGALEDFDKAASLKPDNAGAYYWRAWAYRKLGYTKLADADMKRHRKLTSLRAKFGRFCKKRPYLTTAVSIAIGLGGLFFAGTQVVDYSEKTKAKKDVAVELNELAAEIDKTRRELNKSFADAAEKIAGNQTEDTEKTAPPQPQDAYDVLSFKDTKYEQHRAAFEELYARFYGDGVKVELDGNVSHLADKIADELVKMAREEGKEMEKNRLRRFKDRTSAIFEWTYDFLDRTKGTIDLMKEPVPKDKPTNYK